MAMTRGSWPCRNLVIILLYVQGTSTKEDSWFRALWIPTIENDMWPSDAQMSTERQQGELINILNAAQNLNIDTVVFQVRSHGDAVYASSLEPWSEHLTGRQGKAPQKDWDPLQFLIWHAKERDIKVFVWVNLFRANIAPDWKGLADNHMANVLKEHCYRYGSFLWMDPGVTSVRQHAKDVIMDIVHRYDINGIYLDDYFYPPPLGDEEFPDGDTYQKSQGREEIGLSLPLSRDEWRSKTVQDFFTEIYITIKKDKPHVQVTLDTFGLYKYADAMTLDDDMSYEGFYTSPGSSKWPPTNMTIGDFLAPRLAWDLEEAYEDGPVNKDPMLTDWRLEQDARLQRLYSGDPRYRILRGHWTAFTLCGRETCNKRMNVNGPRHARHWKHRLKRAKAENEDLRNDVSFQLFIPGGTHAAPVVGEGETAPEPDTKPEILQGPIYDIAWSPELDNKTVYVIVHGYRSGPDRSWVRSMREALMKQSEPHGVIVADWSKLSGSKWYPKSQGRTHTAAGVIERLVTQMIESGHTTAENIHCIGHSLGAHTCGLASKQRPLGRITGLDPAGPNFDVKVPDTRLAISDAAFVDVIHSDVGLGEANAGFEEPIGHADFYPNGFRVKQPGCYLPGCSHKRAPKYYTVSVLDDCFNVYHRCPSTRNMPKSCVTKPDGSYFTKMGHHAPVYNQSEGIFFLKTRRWDPYCNGQNSLIHNSISTFTSVFGLSLYYYLRNLVGMFYLKVY